MSTASMPGLFITVEGGEGAGKSTLVPLLSAALQASGYQTLVTREPGGTPLGEKVRQLLLTRDEHCIIGATGELLLFLAARAQHLEELIKPALQQGTYVLCDRFNDSTIAYQGAGRGLGIPYVQELCQLACHHLQPAFTFLLDIDPQQGLARCLRQSGTLDRIEAETLAFHQQIRATLLLLAKRDPQRYIVLDAGAPAEQVATQALQALQARLG